MRTSFDTKYKVLDKIGEGTFSEVLRCQDRQTGALYATKRLKKIYQSVSEILESPELLAMRSVTHHPNVLCATECHYDALPGRLSLVFELMDMSLYDFTENQKGRLLPEMRVKNYVYQLLRGLDHLHRHGVFHRDVKPENILLKGNLLKLGDLGSVRAICVQPPYTEYISTRWYRSPECLLTGGFYGPKMDVWAAGCVFFELLALEPLFPGENEVDQIARIHNVLGTPHARLLAKFRRSRSSIGELYFPSREGRGLLSCLLQKRAGRFSIRGLELLGLMLRYDPDSRAPARKLLEHPYFAGMREPSTRRQTRSSLLSSGERIDDWRYSMELIGHLETDRSRIKLKMSQRVDPCAQLGRYFLRKRRNAANDTQEASKPRPRPREVIQPSFFLRDNFSASLLQQQRCHLPEPSTISRLPSIFSKPSTSVRSLRQHSHNQPHLYLRAKPRFP
ncbi:MAPK/MAK/MRK overlapping kinase-like isoform X2 [Nasonia vitripennis]|uniref:Protein kinase domain-containing protein n=1 Tax=Nasonia vitripennis TaxID=7425 RepID=A0A7M7QS70_NASVI|nr:MAPK/MAK/MRK overlapping kinase-like isoform X2 [Nasonia vitripennis]